MNCSNTIGFKRQDLDIRDRDAVERVLDRTRPSAIINAAAQAKVDLAEVESKRTWQVNAEAPGLLARLANDRGIRCVHLSTDYVLDSPEEERLSEKILPNPRSAYAKSKLAGEQEVLSSDGTVVRLQWVYQPGLGGFFNRALDSMQQGKSIRLVTDQVGCPTPAALLAPALLTIATGSATGLFHLATQGEATAYEWLKAAARAGNVPFTGIEAKRSDFNGAYRPARSVLDSSKVEMVFGVRLPEWRTALQTVMKSDDKLMAGGCS
jgi:dTDP-4-dehydrorhamnose reductase